MSSAVIIGQLSDMWFHCPGFSSTTLQFKKEPLVPIGCLATAYFLASGIKSFQNQDPRRGQKMMRARELFRRVIIQLLPSFSSCTYLIVPLLGSTTGVAAQFATLGMFVYYIGFDRINFEIA
jgi:Hypoxia induced protein conserved region